MKPGKRTLFERLLAITARFGRGDAFARYADEEPPLRSELFSADQMEQHGKNLAFAHRLAPGRAPDQLLTRLTENDGILAEVCDLLTAAVTTNRRITPAAEWLLDNFYLIEEQIRTARRHLPKGYSRELPRLAAGPSAKLPRVYDLAFEAIAHGDGRVDAESLSRFVAAYQTVTPLKVGELWAIPIMLRLALIENLRRVGARIAAATIDRNRADAWADQMVDIAEHDPKSLILVIADMARSNPPMVSSFVAELARRLQGQSAALALPLTWIEQRLSESGFGIEQLVQSETQKQAGDQVSISNTIGSLRFLGSMDWREFVETMSIVEHKLREDPGGLYGRMDFATRDRYRHVVEEIAKGSPLSEGDVARKAIQLAHDGTGGANGHDGDDDRAAHVGFYLVDKGRPRLERAAQDAPIACRGDPEDGPAGPVAAVPGLDRGGHGSAHRGAAWRRHSDDGVPDAVLVTLAVLLLLATSQLAVGNGELGGDLAGDAARVAANGFFAGAAAGVAHAGGDTDDAHRRRRHRRPGRGARGPVPRQSGRPSAFRPADRFSGCAHRNAARGRALLWLARKGIDDLNAKYGQAADPAEQGATGATFFLFHRPRRWNPAERAWMGYERKRGKLADLNAYLRGGGSDRFSLVVGETAVLSNVKYVITLDTDTQLPRDSARQFVGVMAHPLNRARFDAAGKRNGSALVTEGYGILQPRVSISLPGANRSWYARLHGGDPGIDPYTRAVSDVYQDVFREGSFIGKGIYDVDAFEQAQNGRFPENRILSHDLLEGCYARSGLLSDVQLYEECPSTYAADTRRRHRWIRGDWQLAGWLLPLVPGPGKRRLRNPLSTLSQWKLFDNLRRSLVPVALTLLLLLGWAVLPHAWLWTLTVIAILALPPASAFVLDLLRKPDEVLLRQHFAATTNMAGLHAARTTLTLAFLPYEATVNLDAIARTAWRMLVAHRPLLEWNPSAADEPDHGLGDTTNHAGFAASLKTMWIAPVIAAATAILLNESAPSALAVATPLLFLWFVSPGIAWWISRPLIRREPQLTRDQTLFLRNLARRTWAFFETFVGPDDHWLPPDNCQEHPVAAVAHRTSPTNMGLALLANLTAYDFGYIPAGQLLLRTANAMGTMTGTGAARGALLQLVRHAVPEAAPASLCLGGGQREPRGSSDDLAAGPLRTCRRQDHEPAMVRRIERHAADARRCRWRNRAGAARSPAG